MKQAVFAIMKKDIRQVLKNKQTAAPMIVVPLIFTVFLPLITLMPVLMSADAGTASEDMAYVESMLAMMGGSALNMPAEMLNSAQQIAYLMLNYLMMPMFLLIPVMVASVIAANAIVGERERKTLETLLYAPVPAKHIFLGKVLAAFVPAMTITAASIGIYAAVTNTIGQVMMGIWLFDFSNWVGFLCLLTPAFALLGIILMVFVSTKAKTYQSAQQWTIIIILPLVALMTAQTSGLLYVPQWIMLCVGAVLLAVDFILIVKGLGRFTRPKLIQ